MITCPICKKFVKVQSYTINGLEEIGEVIALCKKDGKVRADWDDYDEIVPSQAEGELR